MYSRAREGKIFVRRHKAGVYLSACPATPKRFLRGAKKGRGAFPHFFFPIYSIHSISCLHPVHPAQEIRTVSGGIYNTISVTKISYRAWVMAAMPNPRSRKRAFRAIPIRKRKMKLERVNASPSEPV